MQKHFRNTKLLAFAVMLQHLPCKNELAIYFSHIYCSYSGKVSLPTW